MADNIVIYRNKDGELCSVPERYYNKGVADTCASTKRWPDVSTYIDLASYLHVFVGLEKEQIIDKTGDWDNRIVLIKSRGVAAITPEFNYNASLDRPIIKEALLAVLINDEGYNYDNAETAIKFLTKQMGYDKDRIINKFDKEIY